MEFPRKSGIPEWGTKKWTLRSSIYIIINVTLWKNNIFLKMRQMINTRNVLSGSLIKWPWQRCRTDLSSSEFECAKVQCTPRGQEPLDWKSRHIEVLNLPLCREDSLVFWLSGRDRKLTRDFRTVFRDRMMASTFSQDGAGLSVRMKVIYILFYLLKTGLFFIVLCHVVIVRTKFCTSFLNNVKKKNTFFFQFNFFVKRHSYKVIIV